MLRTYLVLTVRRLRHHPGYAGLNIFTLALGLAVFFALVIVIQYQRSFDRYHAHANRLYRVLTYLEFGERVSYNAQTDGPLGPTLVTDFPEVEAATRLYPNFISSIKRGGDRFDATGLFAEPSLFTLFSFSLVRGSLQAFAQPNTALLTETTARRLFGAADPVGTTIGVRYLGKVIPVQVVGLVQDIPKNSHFTFDLLVSFTSLAPLTGWRGFRFWTYILLRDDADMQAFARKLPAFAVKYLGKDFVERAQFRYDLQALTDIYYDGVYAPNQGDIRYVYLFTAIAAVMLLMGCVNALNFALAQLTVRVHEIGIRKVLGADRRAILVQGLMETGCVTLLAVPIALVLLGGVSPVLRRLTQGAVSLTVTEHLSTVLIGAAGVLGAGLLAGGLPALLLAAVPPVAALQGKLGHRWTLARIQQGLVVLQVITATVLITGVLLIRAQLRYLQDRPLGYDPHHLLVVQLPADFGGRHGWEPLKTALLAHPGITQVTAASGGQGKLGGIGMPFYKHPGNTDDRELIRGLLLAVDENFLSAMRLQLLEGRDFPKGSHTEICIINEAMRHRLGLTSVVGHQIGWQFGGLEVIGVVRDFHVESLHQSVRPVVLRINPSMVNMVLVRVNSAQPAGTIAFIRRTWDKLMPEAVGSEMLYHDEAIADFYRDDRQFGAIFGVFTGVAITIAGLGLLGFSQFLAARKTREIGIRKVLGASRFDILWLFVRQFLGMLGLAVLVAWPAAHLMMSVWLRNFVYRVEVHLSVYLLTGVGVIALVLLSISYSTLKAAHRNPVDTLRAD